MFNWLRRLLLLAVSANLVWSPENNSGESQSFEELRVHAQQGDPHAQANFGLAYTKGNGVSRDDAEAVRWLRKSAEQGDMLGQWFLGIMYFEGRGVPKDESEAVRLCLKAADKGHAPSQSFVGAAYSEGRGVTKNCEESLRWYKKATDQGEKDALHRLHWAEHWPIRKIERPSKYGLTGPRRV